MFKLKIKELRIEKNLTQKQLSEACGISQQYISDLEKPPEHRSKSPTLLMLYRISQTLDICLFELVHCPTCEGCDKKKLCTDRSCLNLDTSHRINKK